MAASDMGKVFVGAIISVFVGVLVAVALFPGITSGVNSLTSGATPQITGTSATLVGNVVLFVALGLMLFAVGFALVWLHGKGAFAFDYAKSIGKAHDLVYDNAMHVWRVARSLPYTNTN